MSLNVLKTFIELFLDFQHTNVSEYENSVLFVSFWTFFIYVSFFEAFTVLLVRY